MRNYLNSLLDEARVTSNERQENAEVIDDIKKVLGNKFDSTVYFRRGGSLAKNTANIYDADIDLLCYLHDSTGMSLENIYDVAYDELSKIYVVNKKNNAIEITGKLNDYKWDYRVDVVPGKYVNYAESYDVYLWCNRDKRRLKTNPDKQISKIRKYEHKDVIRLCKIFRHLLNFQFKSFILELFIVDVTNFNEEDDIIDKIIKVCQSINDLGSVKLYDPANSNNDLSKVLSEFDIMIIKDNFKKIYEALLTDNPKAVSDILNRNTINFEEYYLENARLHSSLFNKIYRNLLPYTSPISIEAKKYDKLYKTQIGISNGEKLKKHTKIRFTANVSHHLKIVNIEWLICNAGYEARKAKQLRGDNLERSNDEEDIIQISKNRYEHTAFAGVHFVIAIVTDTSGQKHYSNPFKVRVE
jgi:hypothetical protein